MIGSERTSPVKVDRPGRCAVLPSRAVMAHADTTKILEGVHWLTSVSLLLGAGESTRLDLNAKEVPD